MTQWAGVTGVIIFWIVLFVAASVPAFVVGRRLDLDSPGEAFIPIVGPTIVTLRSVERSGWMALMQLIPYVGLIFLIWLACVVPGSHGRTRWWILPFLIPLVNFIAFYVYAFTLRRTATPELGRA